MIGNFFKFRKEKNKSSSDVSSKFYDKDQQNTSLSDTAKSKSNDNSKGAQKKKLSDSSPLTYTSRNTLSKAIKMSEIETEFDVVVDYLTSTNDVLCFQNKY